MNESAIRVVAYAAVIFLCALAGFWLERRRARRQRQRLAERAFAPLDAYAAEIDRWYDRNCAAVDRGEDPDEPFPARGGSDG